MTTDVKLIERLRDAQAGGVGSAKLFNLLDEAAAALEAAREAGMTTDVKLIERLRDAQAGGVGSAKLFNLLDEAAAALEAAREDGWKPIETAPKDGTSVLLHYPESGAIEGSWYTPGYRGAMGRWEVTSISSHGCGCCSDHDDQPTHWRSLPTPPAIDQARGKGGAGK